MSSCRRRHGGGLLLTVTVLILLTLARAGYRRVAATGRRDFDANPEGLHGEASSVSGGAPLASCSPFEPASTPH
jgi:hypothetical protein